MPDISCIGRDTELLVPIQFSKIHDQLSVEILTFSLLLFMLRYFSLLFFLLLAAYIALKLMSSAQILA